MAKAHKQLSFSGKGFSKPGDKFGGQLLKGNPKRKRPLDSKLPIHLVMRSTQSRMRSPKAFGKVNTIVRATAAKYGFTIYEYANVGNHIHLLLKISNLRRWAPFIRELSGRIAQALGWVSGISKEIPSFSGRMSVVGENASDRTADHGGERATKQTTGKFWLYRPFTRIVRSWRKAYQSAKKYVQLNQLEANGFISRKEIKTLKDLQLIWADG